MPYQPSACNSDSSTNVMTESRDPSSCGQALSTLRLSQRTVNANNAMDGLGAAVNCSSSKSSPCLGHSCRGYRNFDVQCTLRLYLNSCTSSLAGQVVQEVVPHLVNSSVKQTEGWHWGKAITFSKYKQYSCNLACHVTHLVR